MSQSDRQRDQQEAIQHMLKRQQEARWNPDMPADELKHFRATCEKMFAAVEAVSRPGAMLTKLAHDQPLPRSHMGGAMLMHGDEPWPMAESQPMSGVLEIFLDEIPQIALPSPLKGYSLLQVFLELEWEDPEEPTYEDGAWLVRRIRETEGLVARTEGQPVDEMAMAWQLFPHVAPSYPDNIGLIDKATREAFEALPEAIPLIHDRFPSGSFTRIGGWPRWVGSGGDVGRFCLQLSGDDIGIDLSFDGCLYFGFDEATKAWQCAWEIG